MNAVAWDRARRERSIDPAFYPLSAGPGRDSTYREQETIEGAKHA